MSSNIRDIAIILFLSLVILEGAVRICFPEPQIKNFSRAYYSKVLSSKTPNTKVDLKKLAADIANGRVIAVSKPDGVSFTQSLNLYGFRCNQWEISSNKNRCLVVGDSFVEGFMAPDNETIVQGLRRQAKKNHSDHLDFLNFGVGATSPLEQSSLIIDALPFFKPKYLIWILYANDFPLSGKKNSTEGRPDIHMASGPSSRLLWVISEILAGRRVPTIWKSNPFPFFEPVPNPANPLSTIPKNKLKYIDNQILEAQKKGLFNPFVRNVLSGQEKVLTKKKIGFEPVLKNVRKKLDQANCSLFVAYIPVKYTVTTYYNKFALQFSEPIDQDLTTDKYREQQRSLHELCGKENIPFIDFTDFIESQEKLGVHMYYDFDLHMQGHSYVVLGELLYKTFFNNSDI